MSRLMAAIAANRFGLGARPGEIALAVGDPRAWLKSQIKTGAAVLLKGDLLSAREVFVQRIEARGGEGPPPMPGAAPQPDPQQILQQVQRETREGLQREVEARTRHAVTTATPFAERWLRFWSNHFTVAARSAQLIGLVGPYEREALRPHVFGTFSGLLGHATFHQGMLVYLDAVRSVGPSTVAAQRRDAGLNENLAREILELHTLGVGSGYTQDDIVAFAKALTGWTVMAPQLARLAGAGRRQRIAGAPTESIGDVTFFEALHEPGGQTVLGKRYATAGKLQAAAILDDLAKHPATARHIATKLARHFVADMPPPSAIVKLETAFKNSGGDLSVMAHAVIDLDEAWGEAPQKFKTPEELLISAARAAGAEAAFGGAQRQVYVSLAQAPFSAPSPAGWPDDAASWSGADAIMKRLEWANAVSRRMARGVSPSEFLDAALGELASAKTRQAVDRAESAEQGFTIALMSPEFQRR